MKLMYTPVIVGLAVTLLGLGAAGNVAGQANTYANKPVRLILGAPPGGSSELLARTLVEPFRARFNQSLVIENRPGASGTIAGALAAKAPADGYTLLVVTDTLVTVVPHVYRNLSFNAAQDLVPVTLLTGTSQMLVCNNSVPVKNVADLVALAKQQPLNYASGGAGVPGHLAMELFLSSAGVNMLHIPYKGPAPATLDLIGGRVHCGFLAVPPLLPHVNAGRANALAISSTRRSSVAPQVPTMAESGYKDYDATFMIVLMAPRGTPDSIVQSLSLLANEVLKNSEVQEKILLPANQLPLGGTPAQAASRLREVSAKWEKVVKRIGLSVD